MKLTLLLFALTLESCGTPSDIYQTSCLDEASLNEITSSQEGFYISIYESRFSYCPEWLKRDSFLAISNEFNKTWIVNPSLQTEFHFQIPLITREDIRPKIRLRLADIPH